MEKISPLQAFARLARLGAVVGLLFLSGCGQAAAPVKKTTGPTPPSSHAKILMSYYPSGAVAQGAGVSLGLSGLPQGWELQTFQFVNSTGLKVSMTPLEATTEVPPASQGGFSMGSDGQVISFFFPYPPGAWAGTKVHFVFVYKTAQGKSESVEGPVFSFPKE